MGEARAKVTRGIDRIARGATQRKPNSEDEQCHRNKPQATQTDHDMHFLRTDGPFEFHIGHQEDGQDEAEGANQFAKECLRDDADIRHGAKSSELSTGVCRRLEMLAVEKKDKHRAADASEHLRDNVAGDLRGPQFSGEGHCKGDRRV